jgi:hypothetical protein
MLNPSPDATRPVRLAFYAFCALLPLVGCLTRTAQPQEAAEAAPMAEEALTDGKTPIVVRPPLQALDWQKPPPCDPDMAEVAINGACYVELAKKPPCGRMVEHAGSCYRAIAKAPREPTSIRR